MGGLAGVVLIAFGVIRAVIALLSGGKFAPFTNADLRLIIFYVGAFVLVGGALGAIRIQERVGLRSFSAPWPLASS